MEISDGTLEKITGHVVWNSAGARRLGSFASFLVIVYPNNIHIPIYVDIATKHLMILR